jgi:hypothetical protein
MAAGECHRLFFPDINLYRGLFFGGANIFNDLLCVHRYLLFLRFAIMVTPFPEKHKYIN